MNKLLRSLLLLGLLIGNSLYLRAQVENPLVKHIQDLQATVENRRSYITDLRPDGNYMLPIGLLKAGETNKPSILIDEISLYKDYAELKAYVVLELPGSKNPLYFATIQPIKISYKGGILGTARMELVKERRFSIGGDTYLTVQKSDANTNGDAGTFVEFDCNGFSRARLEVMAELNKKVVKEQLDTAQLDTSRVKAHLTLLFSDLNDILATATIEPFQVKGAPGFTFTATDAVFDWSDFNNAPAVIFPAGYLSTYYNGVSAQLWRGFYLKKVSVKFPPELHDKSANGRKEIVVDNLLIDNNGLTGSASALNMISLQDGDMDGWAFSVDKIAVSFKANQLVSGTLNGGLVLPIGKDDKSLSYDAFIDQDINWRFNVKTNEELQVPIFAAQMTIATGSTVNVSVVSGRFKAGANLSGSLVIGANLSGDANDSSSGNSFKASGITFTNLGISTTSPYVHSGVFGFPSVSAGIAGFDISFSQIALQRTSDYIGLNFKMAIGFSNGADSNNGFSADGDLSIIGRVDIDGTGRHRYLYSRTDINRVHLDIDQGSFKLAGDLNFFKTDPTFGSGFKGTIAMKLPMKIGSAGATALFGSVNGLKYWYADAMLALESGIPVTPLFQVDGFAGGLYYKVKQRPGSAGAMAIVNTETGLAYFPDASAGLGVRAGVMFSLLKNRKAFNGNVGFEIAFNSGGGINRIALMGNANFMQDPSFNISEDTKKSARAFATTDPNVSGYNQSVYDSMNEPGPFSAKAIIEYVETDPASSTPGYLSIVLSSKLNVSNGLITGQFGGEAYFDKNTWHIFLGTPTNRNYISFAGLATLNSYFMVGKDLPATSGPPNAVLQSIGLYKGISKNTVALGSGNGIAFGAGFNFDTGDVSFLIFYAHFSAGLGFDVALKNYGSNIQCTGQNGPMGINGWYASGDAYAYIQGEIGIRVRIFRKSRTFTILGISAGALLQAKLPNPSWFRGAVGGSYRILGGLVKGKCKFEITIGRQCEMIGTPAEAEADVRIISEITPSQGDSDVLPTIYPSVKFETPVDQDLVGEDTDGNQVKFRVDVINFKAMVNGTEISGTKSFNSDNTELTFKPDAVLPGNTNITITASVSFKQYVSGALVDYLKDDNTPYIETMSSTFKTGDQPQKIFSNVTYSYPIDGQKTFFRGETKNGYILLNQKQDYVFQSATPPKAVLVNADRTETPIEISYSNADKKVSFILPDLINSAAYEFIIRSGAPSVALSEDEDIDQSSSELYKISFRTSKYNTLAEKIYAGSKSISLVGNVLESKTGVILDSDEEFDDLEIFGSESRRLINFETDWSFISPYKNIYYNYPIDPEATIPGLVVTDRKPNLQFIVPVKGTQTFGPWGTTTVSGDARNLFLRYNAWGLLVQYYTLTDVYQRFYYKYAGRDPEMYSSNIFTYEGAPRTGGMQPSPDYPNGYPYFGDNGPKSYMNYWSLNSNQYSYYSVAPPTSSDPGINYANYQNLYHSKRKQYAQAEPNAEMDLKVHMMMGFINSDFQQFDPLLVKVFARYKLPGTNITTSYTEIKY